MNILSLFDGISCGRVALERAGIKVDKYFASEIDKYAIQIAKKNYPDTIHIGSVTDVVIEEESLDTMEYSNIVMKTGLGQSFDISYENRENGDERVSYIDMIIGGSPCQDLSIAKKDGKGLQGEKSSLFFEYVRLLKEVRPKYFLLENVASMKKADKEEITRVLTEVYPDTQCYLINSALVSAQNRKRLYWTNIQGVGQPEDKGIVLQDILQDGAEVDERMIVNGKSYSLTASYNGAVEWNSVAKKQRTMVKVGQFNSGGQGDRVYSPEGKSVSLSANGGGRGAKTRLYEVGGVALRNRGEGKKPEFNGTEKANSMTTVQADSMVFVGNQFNNRIFTDKTGTLGTGMGRTAKQGLAIYKDEISEKGFIRKLTPIECERLQTLEDDYTSGVSNTQRYKAIGNGWTVDVIAHIFSYIK